MRKKILILANNDIGLYKFRKELIQKLIEQGDEVFISIPNGPMVSNLINLGCKFLQTDVDRRGKNLLRDFKLIIEYLKIFNSIRPDSVITYTIKPNIYGGLISRIKKVKYFVNITGLGTTFQKDNMFKKIIIYLYKISGKKSNMFFFENENNKKIFLDNQIVEIDKACNLNGAGVNLEEYIPAPYPLNNETINFLFIGRIMKEKGVEELFSAAEEIAHQYGNVKFNIVGELEEDYQKIIMNLEEKGILNYYGHQNDVKPFIRESHCFVLPSYHEGMANTLLECGAMGRPLIASNISGCKETIINYKTGYLIAPRSISELKEAIVNFIKLTPKEKEEMGMLSRKHIANNFDKQLIIEKTLRILNK